MNNNKTCYYETHKTDTSSVKNIGLFVHGVIRLQVYDFSFTINLFVNK